MSIVWKVPKKSRYIPTSTIFIAEFGNPTAGRYDFNTIANRRVNALDLAPGSTYLIERMSVGGNITEGQYLESINAFPVLRIMYGNNRGVIYEHPFPIVNYTDNTEVSGFAKTIKGNDYLALTFEGMLNQLPSMVGLQFVKIQVSFTLYQIPFGIYEREWEI